MNEIEITVSDQAAKLIEEYNINEDKLREWWLGKMRNIAGSHILDYMVEEGIKDGEES